VDDISLVNEFFDRVHAGDLTVCEMYAPDGIRVDHEGREFRGRDSIRQVYAGMFPLPATHPEVAALLRNPPFLAAVMQWPGRSGEGSQYIDLFEIEDGLIRALRVLV
jgi:hypothetical protein